MRSTLLLYGCMALMLAGCTDPQAAPKPDAATKLETGAEAQPAANAQAPSQAPSQPSGHGATPEVEDPSTLQAAASGKAYGQILIQTSAEDVFAAELTIVRDEGVKALAGTFSYTAEPTVLVAKPRTTVHETNLLGSGFDIDLDDDGKTSSTIETACEDGVVVLKTTPPRRIESVTELTEDVARFAYGEGGSRLISRRGAGAVLYSPCDKGLTFGLDPTKPLTLIQADSPSVFVVYRAKVDAADAPDPFKLVSVKAGEDDLPHTVYPFREYDLTKGESPEIFAAHLVVFAVDSNEALQHITVKISGDKPEFITASINEVDAQGQRIRYADGFKRF